MKIIHLRWALIFVLLHTSEVFLAQEIIPDKNEFQYSLKEINKQKYYKGKIYRLNDRSLLRFRTYGKTTIQSSYVYEINNLVNIRFYYYLRITDLKLTPALSIKIRI